jgi:hypothetical protein
MPSVWAALTQGYLNSRVPLGGPGSVGHEQPAARDECALVEAKLDFGSAVEGRARSRCWLPVIP